jgi:phage baseplate assembly protein V
VSFNDDHSQNDVPRFQNFGFTSHPPKDSEALILHLGGEKNFPIIVSADHREKRLKDLDEGESAVYNAHGSKIHLKNGGKVVIDNGTFELISLINDLTQALAAMTVPSPAGPVPPINVADFVAIKTKLESFKA